MDKISVIVPVYNVEKYLNRCVQSILSQTYKDLEIILVDDGATDRSGAMCDTYKNDDDRIIVVHKQNEGLGLARNTGLKYATGKYVMFVDSDDYIDSDVVAKLYDDLVSNMADTCIGGFTRVSSSNIKEIHENAYLGNTFEGDSIKKILLPSMFGKSPNDDKYTEMSVWKVLFTKSIIDSNNIIFPSEREFISEDIIFDIDYYSKAKKIYMSSCNGYNYCDNAGTLTTRYNPDRFSQQVKLYKELIKRTDKIGILVFCKERLDNTLISIARYSIKLEVKYRKKNGILHEKKKIKEICENKVLKNVFNEFDNSQLPIGSKLINFFIKNKMIKPLEFIMILKSRLGV
ncbi:glycosyltransferase family 2 protein [Ligilactobacillus equi]|uniref:Glycosyltransferase protein n=1 Tax=Ligilactobacillus equi DSM 15833 = JCM 10991 TaxID=1423740 RepID=A0A0R1TF44_9LACO|nr:glycosyltransferase family 2 protein [Ligilactobacillus equi]KRL79705.1 glycosyltransferase protein [Ligilactobacillus equi DSM 15833 = JCM 10991]